jgi:hypothetical protein
MNPKFDCKIPFRFCEIKTMCIHTNPVWVNPKEISQMIFPILPIDFSPKEENDPGNRSDTVIRRLEEKITNPDMTIIEIVPNSHPAL